MPSTRTVTGPRPARHLIAAALALAITGGCGKSGNTPATPAGPTTAAAAPDPAAVVTKMLSAVAASDPSALDPIDPQKFVQHDPSIADGLDGLKAHLATLPPGSLRIKPVRVFADGDTVVAQSTLDFNGQAFACFDVYRFEGGKIVEHWDCSQYSPPTTNPGGHTMTDGPTAVADESQTNDNKAIARRFVEHVVIGGRGDEFAAYFDGDHYVQHDPDTGDGLSGLALANARLAGDGVRVGYAAVRHVYGRGNFVLVVSDGTRNDQSMAFYDLFRLDRGKLAERWEAAQPIPPRAEWKNNNGNP